MNNQEAIASLKTLCHTCELFPKCVHEKPECFQAIELAISALQAQEAKAQLSAKDICVPCKDTISRQAAIALANSLKNDLPDDERIADIVMAHNEGILEYQTKLSLLPSAKPEIEERTEESAQNVPKEDLISRKAAIEALGERPMVWTDDDQYALGERNQYDMNRLAIETLPSAQPEPLVKESRTLVKDLVKDTISRQAAIDAPFKKFDMSTGVTWIPLEYIEQLPAVQPQPQWIPVSERLPEELEAVIITWKNHEPEPYYSDIKHKPFIGVGIYHREKWWWWSAYAEDMLAEYGDSKADRMDEAIEVTAWMPLPEPYRAERRTDE